MFAAVITDLKTPYIIYLSTYFSAKPKRLNSINFRLCFIETMVVNYFFLADWRKKLASITSPLTFLNISETANPQMKMLASLISGLAICAHQW